MNVEKRKEEIRVALGFCLNEKELENIINQEKDQERIIYNKCAGVVAFFIVIFIGWYSMVGETCGEIEMSCTYPFNMDSLQCYWMDVGIDSVEEFYNSKYAQDSMHDYWNARRNCDEEFRSIK